MTPVRRLSHGTPQRPRQTTWVPLGVSVASFLSKKTRNFPASVCPDKAVVAVAGRDLFFGAAGGSDASDRAFKAMGSAVIDITPGDRFELIARQTSASTKYIAAHELTRVAHI
jgi:hypothetical protein